MKWAAVHSTLPDPQQAAQDAAGRLLDALGDGPIDLVLAFYSTELTTGAEEVRECLMRTLAPGCLAGVSAAGVITTDAEIEHGPALSLVGARLPGVSVSPFLLGGSEWGDEIATADLFDLYAPGARGAELALLFADPYTLDMPKTLHVLREYAPGLRVVGGMASSGMGQGGNMLFLNEWLSPEGGMCIALSGALRADVIVSQGCRPIGPPMTVTKAERNYLIELDDEPALERFNGVLAALTPEEHAHLGSGLFVGRPVHGDAEGRGDYLIRNVIGADRVRGVVAVGDLIESDERIRLHVRDGDTAREDLEMLLLPQSVDTRAHAALVFSCNGRGSNLYSGPDGDITPLQDALGGQVPAAGFFCNGEIGPVGDRNYVHGHTASIAIIRPA